MDKTTREDAVKALIKNIEECVGRPIKTPRDFSFLRECIFVRNRVYLSESTLKRVWGYIPQGNPRDNTLDALSSFLGYDSWLQFKENLAHTSGEIPSSFTLGRHLSPRENLMPGERLLLVWQPNRRCEILYLGDDRFEVINSAFTRLSAGDNFTCHLFIEGEPLFISDLVQGGKPPVGYICGKISGIRFQKL